MKNFQYDKPIKNQKDDELEFGPFAKRVAQGILNYDKPDNFIISIEGKWGSGKTSLVNLIENEIEDKVEIIHFNPWLISDLNKVIKIFFDELIKILAYGSFKVKWNEEIKKDFKKIVNIVLPDELAIGNSVKAKYNIKESLKSKESLEYIKSKINDYLQDLDRKIVIIIDDIDRLTDKETEFIFRLIKGVADFDNLIYILLYDKNVITKSIETFKSENGERFLEKIVQYPIAMPRPHGITLENILFKRMDEVLDREINRHPDDKFFQLNKEIWDNFKYGNIIDINKYISNIRNVNRLTNIISFEYPMIAEDVNFLDFFLITIVRLKNIELYEYIKDNFYTLFNSGLKSLWDSDEEIRQREIENYKNLAQKYKEYKDILDILFCNFINYDWLPCYIKKYSEEEKQIKNHTYKFLEDPYYFENYFSFTVSADKLSYKEYRDTLEKMFSNDFESFREKIFQLESENKIKYFIEMFEQNYLDNINNEVKYKKIFLKFIKLINSKNYRNYINLLLKILGYMQNRDKFLLDFFNDKNTNLYTKYLLFIHLDKKHSLVNIEILKKISNILKQQLEKMDDKDILKCDMVILVEMYKNFHLDLQKLKDIMFKNENNFLIILKNSQNDIKDICEKLKCLNEAKEYIKKIDRNKLSPEDKKILNNFEKELEI